MFLNLIEMNTSGFYIDDILNLTPKDTHNTCIDGLAIIVDARKPEMLEYKKLDVQFFFHIRLNKLLTNKTAIPTDKMIISADAIGIRSKQAAAHYKEFPESKVVNMTGDILEWDRYEPPMVVDNKKHFSRKTMFDIKENASRKP